MPCIGPSSFRRRRPDRGVAVVPNAPYYPRLAWTLNAAQARSSALHHHYVGRHPRRPVAGPRGGRLDLEGAIVRGRP